MKKVNWLQLVYEIIKAALLVLAGSSGAINLMA